MTKDNNDSLQELTWLEPQTPEQIVAELIEKYQKDSFYVLFSGGKDSVCIADFISKNYPEYFKGVIFTNTGLGTQATRKWVIEYAKARNWPLIMTWARKSFYDIVMEKGFPNMGAHKIIMGYLKFQSWYYLYRDHLKGLGGKPCFISGVRKKESWARDKVKFYSKKPIDVNATMTFCKPFLFKNGSQLLQYFIENGLQKSPAYDWFDKSGECWCGCYNHPWELKMLERYDSLTFNTIQWLEKQLQVHGTKEAKKFPNWGRSVGADYSKMQTGLFDVNEDYCGESCVVG